MPVTIKPASYVELFCDTKPTLIYIFHPARPHIGKQFFRIPAYDKDSNDENLVGVYHQTLLDLCCVVAYNQPGCFVFLQDSSPLSLPSDSIVPPGDYIFRLDNKDDDYELCHNFSSWPFPKQLPDSWQAIKSIRIQVGETVTNDSGAVRARDGRCRVTGESYSMSSAHLVPNSEKEWFEANRMDQHSLQSGKHGVDDISNKFSCRYDLHMRQLDAATSCVGVKMGQTVVHFLSDDQDIWGYLVPRYHNNTFKRDGLAIPYIYARFAWAAIKNLVDKGQKKRTQHPTSTSQSSKRKRGGAGGGDGGRSDDAEGDGEGDQGGDEEQKEPEDYKGTSGAIGEGESDADEEGQNSNEGSLATQDSMDIYLCSASIPSDGQNVRTLVEAWRGDLPTPRSFSPLPEGTLEDQNKEIQTPPCNKDGSRPAPSSGFVRRVKAQLDDVIGDWTPSSSRRDPVAYDDQDIQRYIKEVKRRWPFFKRPNRMPSDGNIYEYLMLHPDIPSIWIQAYHYLLQHPQVLSYSETCPVASTSPKYS